MPLRIYLSVYPFIRFPNNANVPNLHESKSSQTLVNQGFPLHSTPNYCDFFLYSTAIPLIISIISICYVCKENLSMNCLIRWPNSSDVSFKQNLIPNLYPVHALFFVPVEIEAQRKTGIQVPVIEIFSDLFLPIRVIPWTPPYLQLNDILLSEIIDYDVRPGLITGLGFNVVIPRSIDDRFQIQKKLLPSVSSVIVGFQYSY